MTSRAQVQFPLYARDRLSVLEWAQVQVYEEDGITPFTGTLWRSRTGEATYPNPFVASPAVVRFHLDAPDRIVLGYKIDRSATEMRTRVIDPWVDSDELVITPGPLWIEGVPVAGGLLRAVDADTAGWFQPGLSPHPHAGYAPGSTRIGPDDAISARIASYPNTTSLGAASAQLFADPQFFFTWGQLMRRAATYRDLSFYQWGHWAGSIVLSASVDLTGSTMFGFAAFGIGGYVSAAGVEAYAADGTPTPFVQGALALGYRARAFSGSLAIGRNARSSRETDFIAAEEQGLISIGRNAGGAGVHAVSLGANALGSQDGLAIGFGAGGALGSLESVALGSGALLATDTPRQIALGTTATRPDTLVLPPESLVRLPSALRVAGDVAMGHRDTRIGFYGSQGATQPSVGEQEVGSGIPALDSLIQALRVLGLLKDRTEPVLRYEAQDLASFLGSGDTVTEWPGDEGTLRLEAGAATLNHSALFNGLGSVALGSSTRLVEQGPSQASTYLVVASHSGSAVTGESLLTLDVDDPRATVLAAASSHSVTTKDTWKPVMSAYVRDGLDQTANRRMGLDGGPHAYRASFTGGWPQAPLVLGKPPATIDTGWRGSVAEVIGLDDTWSELDRLSLGTGLMFKYGIGQDPAALTAPALARIAAGQEVAGQTYVDLDHRFALTRPYPASGVVRSAAPVANGTVKIYTTTGGVRTLETTVPLRADGTFFGVVRNPGYVTAEALSGVTRVDVGRVLPPTTDGETIATTGGLALMAMALLRMPATAHFRAELLLRALSAAQAVDGGIPSGITLATGAGYGTVRSGPLAMVGMAALRYAEVTGDAQFAALADLAGSYLRGQLNGGGLVPSSTDEVSYTADAVRVYLLWRALGWTGPGSPGALLKQSLDGLHWLDGEQRPAYSVTWKASTGAVTVNSLHDLWTDLWSALYYDALGETDRAKSTRRALASFRIRDAVVPEPVTSGLFPSSLLFPATDLFPEE